MKFFNEQNSTPWSVLLIYAQKTESASFYINKNDGFLLKYFFKDPRKISMEQVNTTMEAIKTQLLTQKSIDDVPFFKEYKIDPINGEILIDCIDLSIGKGNISSDYYLGKTAIVGKTRELDWVVDQFKEVGINVDIEEIKPSKPSLCSLM